MFNIYTCFNCFIQQRVYKPVSVKGLVLPEMCFSTHVTFVIKWIQGEPSYTLVHQVANAVFRNIGILTCKANLVGGSESTSHMS